jgi:tripartite-type tricarboxylate transporter receptor subunit TctC
VRGHVRVGAISGKPVRVVVPFAAGGTPDVVGRIISQQLAAQTGQPFVVENRPGADGVLGAQTVAESPPDGYTLLVTSSSFVVNPSFHKKLPFDVVRDFEPVSNLALTEAYILGVNPGLPVSTVQELITLARRADSKSRLARPESVTGSISPPSCSSRSPGHRWYTSPTAARHLRSPA